MRRQPRPLPRLRAITSTGERFAHADVEAIREQLPSVAVFPMYGLTECKRVAVMTPHEIDLAPESVGRPLDGTEVRVVDEAGRGLPAGCVGELQVRGRHVTAGYWPSPSGEPTERFEDGPIASDRTLRTGDLCHLDERGFLYLHGRKDGIVKRRGIRMSLLELERAAYALEGVVDAGAVLLPGDRLVLFVQAGDPETVAHAPMLGALRDRLESYKLPDEIRVVSVLPRTLNGKLDRSALEAVAR